MTRTYFIATANRDYSSTSAKSAASVAAAWKRQGLAPQATVITDDAEGRPITRTVSITTMRSTAAALAAA